MKPIADSFNPSVEISQVTFEINKQDQDDADEKENIPTKECFEIEKLTKDAQKFEIKNLKDGTKYQIRGFYEHKFGINGKFSNLVDFETRKRLRLCPIASKFLILFCVA